MHQWVQILTQAKNIISLLSSKIVKSESPIISSANVFSSQIMKYTSNVTRVIDDGVLLRTPKDNQSDPTCSFHYTIQQSNGFTRCRRK